MVFFEQPCIYIFLDIFYFLFGIWHVFRPLSRNQQQQRKTEKIIEAEVKEDRRKFLQFFELIEKLKIKKKKTTKKILKLNKYSKKHNKII